MTEQELVAVVYCIKKSQEYFLRTRLLVHNNHDLMRDQIENKDAKRWFIRRVLQLQEFDIEVIDHFPRFEYAKK